MPYTVVELRLTAPLVEVMDMVAADDPSLLPAILTVLAPDMLPLVITTLVITKGLFDVITNAPDRTPPVIVMPDCALAPADKLVLFVVIVLPVVVTKPATLPPVKLMLLLVVIAPETVLSTSVTAPLPPCRAPKIVLVPAATMVPYEEVRLILAKAEPIVLLFSEKPLFATILMVVLAVKISPLARVMRPLPVQV